MKRIHSPWAPLDFQRERDEPEKELEEHAGVD
jgi:hypothetical protein